jgi:two-component system, OmpR family, sensor kinase
VSLRRRLVAGVLALLVAAIVVTNVVTSSSLRSFLVGRLDEQLDVAQEQAYNYILTVYSRDRAAKNPVLAESPVAWLDGLADPSATLPGEGDASAPVAAPPSAADHGPRLNATILAARLSPDIYVQVIDATGTVVFDDPSGLVSASLHDPSPRLPAKLPVEAQPPPHSFGQGHGPYVPDRPSFEVPAQGSRALHYRAQAVAVPGGTLVTAVALAPTQATLDSLTHVELLVSGIVVLALIVLVLWIVRFGLRPLDDMTSTAGDIAAGDLTRRVQPADDRSEVGRLGGALNGMLDQIESTFDEQTRSEVRLRGFVADASHELRTPLTSIRGYAELLRKGALTDEDERQRAAERIELEAQRMSVLVDDLLLLARLDQGRPIDRVPLSLDAVVAEAVDAARAVDDTRPISYTCPVPVTVAGDAARLRQVADNLLRNALVHTPPGTPIDVRVSARGSLAVLSVADAGPGLEPEQAARVFDRFYQGSAARTGSGSGLGLSIVAALAAAHGGRAMVESVPGAGCTFVVELPRDIWGTQRGRDTSGTSADVDGDIGLAGAGHDNQTRAPQVGEPVRSEPDRDDLVRPVPG